MVRPPTSRTLPMLAYRLGLGGLVPFVACTVLIIAYPAHVPVPRLVLALLDYGAVILSFLGAVHWGLALAGPAAEQYGRTAPRLALGVMPALIGWAALLVPLVASPLIGVVMLVLGFGAVIGTEAAASRAGAMPRGYLTLRWLLTAVVELCLLAVLLVRLL